MKLKNQRRVFRVPTLVGFFSCLKKNPTKVGTLSTCFECLPWASVSQSNVVWFRDHHDLAWRPEDDWVIINHLGLSSLKAIVRRWRYGSWSGDRWCASGATARRAGGQWQGPHLHNQCHLHRERQHLIESDRDCAAGSEIKQRRWRAYLMLFR